MLGMVPTYVMSYLIKNSHFPDHVSAIDATKYKICRYHANNIQDSGLPEDISHES